MQRLEARRSPLDYMPWRRKVTEILAPVSCSTGPDDLETWLLARIAEALEADPLRIDPLLPPSVYGFEAGPAKALTRDLERCLGRALPGNLFDSGRSVRAVAHGLCAGVASPSAPPPLSRDEMRRQVLARAARRPRRPSSDPGEGLRRGRAGCSRGAERSRLHTNYTPIAHSCTLRIAAWAE